MGSTLYWEPYKANRKSLSDELKNALRERLGTGFRREPLEVENVDFLEGLSCAGIKDAQVLIDAIDKHGGVYVSEEY